LGVSTVSVKYTLSNNKEAFISTTGTKEEIVEAIRFFEKELKLKGEK